MNENALKHRFGQAMLDRMASSLHSVHPAFDHKQFRALFPRVADLEMKARVHFLRDELQKLLPTPYPDALKIILQSIEAKKLQDFDFWVYTEFVQTHGLEHETISLEALKQLTTHFTSEWAVRPFLRRAPERTLAFLLACANHPDEKIRRWASEGSRSRLPWGERLHQFIAEPALTRPILEALKFDAELFVRTSVANHLNDLAKDHPDHVIEILKRWKTEAAETHAAKIDWIIRRALRTLIKLGNPKALALIGVGHADNIEVHNFSLTPKTISMGERLNFSCEIISTAKTPQKLVIDYIIHFVKAHGGTAPKVFKLKVLELAAGQSIQLQKAHAIKPITTRKYYPGENALELQINGRSFGKKGWGLR